MEIQVCIVEDHKPLRESLAQLIGGSEGFHVCGVFPNANNIIKNLRDCLPDVVLMDIRMPGLDGISALQVIRKEFPELRIIMQTVFEEDAKIFSAICAGANGYILKNTPPQKYLEAVREAFEGGAPVSSSIATKVLAMFRQQNSGANEQYHLSEREREVLGGLVNGLSYKMIADKHSISYDTVRFHMKNIYAKLHVSSMTEAVAKAIQNRLT